ncbi:MAG: hypothetical protein M3Z22_01755 [Verrucomicrobiota bacterium]|nr:hypothetical protein [Verrucomicrobiota bacterium]
MKTTTHDSNAGNTLVVTLSVIATILVLLGSAVEYTTHMSRLTQRSRKTALAMEIADGHLETLFTSWRNIYRTTFTTYTTSYSGSGGTDYSLLPTNYFFTTSYNPGPAPSPITYMSPAATPNPIPLPSASLFPTEANYNVTQYRIQAVNPMIQLDANENAVDINGNPLNLAATAPAAYGPNDWQYSYFYLASVDVSVPALTGNVTAKVRRVFEKKFDNPWTYAMFYVDDLELQPTTALSITGPVHTNANLYIGTSNFSVPGPTWPNAPTSGRVEYGADYINGYSPKDGQNTGTPTAPVFAKSDSTLTLSDMPPCQVSPYLPFGWNLNLSTASGGSTNDDSYHELIERPAAGADPIAGIRYYSQKPYVIDSQNVLAGYAGTPGNSYRILINEHSWKFANAAARTAAGSYVSTDIGKVGYEYNNSSATTYGTFWKLTSLTPTWTIIPQRTTYAFPDATARNAAGSYTLDLTKPFFAYQYDNDTFWKLTGVTGGTTPTWTQVTIPNPFTIATFGPLISSWTFSNIGNRTASGSYTQADIGKVCFQSDDLSFWRLTSMTKSGSIITPIWTSALQADAVTIYQWDGTNTTQLLSSGNSSSGLKNANSLYDTLASYVKTTESLNDNREGGLVRMRTLDVNAFSLAATNGTLSNFSGVLYIADYGATYRPTTGSAVAGVPVDCTISGTSTTETKVTRRGIRLKNGATLLGKLTIVSDNPIYIQGDYNTGGSPPSNSGTYTSPTVSGYTRWASAIIGDSINLLSGAWTDSNSTSNRSSRTPQNTTVNSALVSGNVPSSGGSTYSGGGENFVRFLEDWNKYTFCYYGSMVQLYKSQQGTGQYSTGGQVYQPPTFKWFYDVNFSGDHNSNAHFGSPPGNLQIAAYLQQQRWYQVY